MLFELAPIAVCTAFSTIDCVIFLPVLLALSCEICCATWRTLLVLVLLLRVADVAADDTSCPAK